MKILLFFLTLNCLGCVTTTLSKMNPALFSQDVQFNIPQPDNLLPDIKIVQYIQMKYKDRSNTIQSVVHKKNSTMSVTGLSPWGASIYNLKYDGKSIKEEFSVPVPTGFDAKRVLSDIALSLSSVKNIKNRFNVPVKIKDLPLSRLISIGGKKFMNISYSTEKRFFSNLKIDNFFDGYQLDIKFISGAFL